MGSLLLSSQDLNLISTLTTTVILEPNLPPSDEPPPYFSSPLTSQDTTTTTINSEFNRLSQQVFHFQTNKLTNPANDAVSHPDIVPVPEPDAPSYAVAPSRRPSNQRLSSELVRVAGLEVNHQRYFRDLVRKTRMVYDSLRVFAMNEYDKLQRLGMVPAVAGAGAGAHIDLQAASVMMDRGLWLNRDNRIVGTIPGVYVGDVFCFRMELCVVGLHGASQAGIGFSPAIRSSNKEPIATSVVLSGGYEEDEDGGDVVIYTGQGGQDKNSRQCGHQKLEGGNLALERSMYYGIEVRVIRGRNHEGSVSGKVYVYDGLYKIVDYWFDVGKSGFGVYKYKMVRIDNQIEMGSAVLRFAENLRTDPLSVRPVGYYVSFDMSMNKENVPVLLYNDIDSELDPVYYEYITTSVFPSYVYHAGGKSSGCQCVSGCMDGCLCAKKNGGEFAYDQNGILVRGKPLIFECGTHCQCPPHCRNRVSQKGVRNRLEVFRSRETGSWGVRSLDLIQAGAFICEFAGVVVTRGQAQVLAMNGDSLVYPNRFMGRWTEWGDLSQIFTDYVHPAYPLIPPLDFAMDVSRMRNVACYISHCSTPNVLVQFVLYDHNNLFFPHLMVFALENIPPLRELSLDYGNFGVADESNGLLRFCN